MKLWVLHGTYESEMFTSIHLTEKGCALAAIADVMEFFGIDSDEEALRVMNDSYAYRDTDGEQTEPFEWDHERLKDMTSEQLWKVFNQWCEISWDEFGHRCYNIDAQPMEIQA